VIGEFKGSRMDSWQRRAVPKKVAGIESNSMYVG